MDVYDAALRRLRADPRTPKQLKNSIGLPTSTISDLKSGACTNPRLKTARKVVAHYFPKSL